MIKTFGHVTTSIKNKINSHHSLYPNVPVKAEYWESILVAALKEIPDTDPSWDCGSQKIGRDITLKSGTEISCKAGQIQSDGRLKFSSSTLSRYKGDRDAMLHYLNNSKTEDYIYCLSTYKVDRKKFKLFDGRYLCSVFNHNFVDYSTMEWSTFGKNGSIRGDNSQNVKITITEAMGWQVWYYIPMNIALASTTITVPENLLSRG